jgi:hypothetical protein
MRYDTLTMMCLSLALAGSLQTSIASAGQSSEAAAIDRETDAALKKLLEDTLEAETFRKVANGILVFSSIVIGTTIKSYADAYNAGKGEIPNEAAKKLLADALAVDESEVKLRQSYSAKMGKVLTATKVARDLQIEKKIRAIIKFELASQIPLAS